MASEEILHMTIESLVKTNEQQARQLEEMSVRIKELTAQLAWFQRRMFGRSSEKRMALDGQPSLFDSTGESVPVTGMEEERPEEKPVRTVMSRKASTDPEKTGRIFPYWKQSSMNRRTLTWDVTVESEKKLRMWWNTSRANYTVWPMYVPNMAL